MTGKHILAMIAVVAMVTALAVPAQKQVVICKDGRRLTGEVTKVKDGYQIRIQGGIVVNVKNDQVLKVEDVITTEDELANRLDKVDSRDADGYYQVARWAYGQNLLADTRKILQKVLRLEPDHENAQLLLKLVKMRMTGSDDNTTTKNGAKKPPPLKPSNFLTKEDIYRIRLMELKPNDRVSIKYQKKVLERFIESMRGSGDFEEPEFENKFRKFKRVKQVLYILDNTDRENASIRDDILINSDPRAIRIFRTRVWPIIAKSFGSPNCYGGAKPKDGLKLLNIPLTDERVLYTNFYILHKWEHNGQKMINRDNPEMSLLLQYGLPRKIAKCPRPDYVPGPIYTSQNDRSYKVTKEWISSLKRMFPPGYRINYTLPGQTPVKPATRPATPTTKPADKQE